MFIRKRTYEKTLENIEAGLFELKNEMAENARRIFEDDKTKKLEERILNLEARVDQLAGELSMKIDKEEAAKRIGKYIESIEKSERTRRQFQ